MVRTSCAAGVGGSRIRDVPGGYRGNHKAGASRRKGSRPPSGRKVRARLSGDAATQDPLARGFGAGSQQVTAAGASPYGLPGQCSRPRCGGAPQPDRSRIGAGPVGRVQRTTAGSRETAGTGLVTVVRPTARTGGAPRRGAGTVRFGQRRQPPAAVTSGRSAGKPLVDVRPPRCPGRAIRVQAGDRDASHRQTSEAPQRELGGLPPAPHPARRPEDPRRVV